MSDERLKRLEERIAFLDRHVSEQDKVMLELGDQIGRLRRELKRLREAGAPTGGTGGATGEEASTDERPPHY